MDDSHFSQLKERVELWDQLQDVDWGNRREVQDLTDLQIEGLAVLLMNRMLDVGLQPDSEPNEFGLAVDDLIGMLYMVKIGREI